MRVYGRTTDLLTRLPTWREIDTDIDGDNSYVYVTAFVQCCKLNMGESPFWANWGIAAKQAVQQQLAPDFDMQQMQARFAQFFASLSVIKSNNNPPTYNVTITTMLGVMIPGIVISYGVPNGAPPHLGPR